MTGRISQEKIDRIREANDIVDLVSQYLPLKKAGKYFKALCPFHTETSPSFFVSPEKQIYHCFGCGRGGNVFTFMMEYEKVSFPEALRALAKKAGISLPRGKGDGGYDHLYRANEFACQLWHEVLRRGEKAGAARKYLLDRGIGEDLHREFKLGFAPSSWDFLIKRAERASIQKAALKQAGLLRDREEGGYYDYFRNRIIFPILNVSGRVIGFGGRVLDDSLPKYLNSPDTPIYKKGESLYGLYQAKSAIRSRGEALVVEGYSDLLSLYQADFKNVVAALGTALTQSQAKLLSRYASRTILIYDPDPSGKEAVLRGGDLLSLTGAAVKVVSLPSGEDPDDFLRKRGKGEFEKLLSQADDFVDFKLNHLSSIHDLSTLDGRVEATKAMASSLSKIADGVRRSLSVQKVARALSIGEDLLLSCFPKAGGRDERKKPFFLPKETPHKPELQLVGLVMREREVLPLVRESLSPADLRAQGLREVMTLIYKAEDEGRSFDPTSLLNLVGEEGRRVISEALFWEGAEVDWKRMARDLITRIKGAHIETEMTELKREIEEAEKRGEPHHHLLRKYQQLAQERIR